ncbi:MAG: hypothetical protein ACYDA4_17410 [Ignavibacteriaceae bacterium]
MSNFEKYHTIFEANNLKLDSCQIKFINDAITYIGILTIGSAVIPSVNTKFKFEITTPKGLVVNIEFLFEDINIRIVL